MQSYRDRILGLLGQDDPLALLESTPARVREVHRVLGPAGLTRSYATGKWSAQEILAHLADVELAIGFRVRQALAQPNYRVEPFDQDLWARRYREANAALAVDALGALRAWNLNLLRSLSPEDLARRTQHPERGEETVEVIIRMLAGHDRNHLAQLESIPRS